MSNVVEYRELKPIFLRPLLTALVDDVPRVTTVFNARNACPRCLLVPVRPPPVLLPFLSVRAQHASGGRGVGKEEGAPSSVAAIASPPMIVMNIVSNTTVITISPIIVTAAHRQGGDTLTVSVARVLIPSWTLRKSIGPSFNHATVNFTLLLAIYVMLGFPLVDAIQRIARKVTSLFPPDPPAHPLPVTGLSPTGVVVVRIGPGALTKSGRGEGRREVGRGRGMSRGVTGVLSSNGVVPVVLAHAPPPVNTA